MNVPYLSTYLVYLLTTAHPHHAPKATPAPAAPQIVIEQEHRSSLPTVKADDSLGRRVAAADDADTVVDNVQKFYAGIKQVSAKFRQYITNTTFGTTKQQDGKVLIKKPGKMRWDYFNKKKKTIKTFISNGSYLYVVDYENKQVIEKNLEKNMLPVAVTFLYGKGDLKTDFDAKTDDSGKYGGKDDIVLKLTPKEASAQYKYLYLVVDPSNYRVKESVIIDGSKNTNRFKFYEPDFDTKIKDGLFKFNKKKVPDYRITTDDDDDSDAKSDKGDKTE